MPSKKPIEDAPLPDAFTEHVLLTSNQVTALTGLNRRRRLTLERENRFPKPIRVTNKLLLYPSRKIVKWIEQRSRGL